MNKIKGIILSFLITALIGTLLFMSYMTEESFAMPDSIYQVYLDGEKIGLVESKEELYSLINKEQKEIKKEYNVNQVYPPKGFKIIRQTTYKEEVNSIEEVYEAIKEKKQFTIKGYSITIKGSLEGVEPQYVYVIDETIFEKALSNVVVTFIGEDRYKQYLTATQPAVTSTGMIIEDMYFDETITIKESYISVDETIYTDVNELTKYLLFGTNANYKEYKVKQGDTIENIAEANGINSNALLMVNENLETEDTLLAIGQKLNVAAITPVLSLVYDAVVTEDQEVMYGTTYENDKTMYVGKTKVKTKGVKGIDRVTSAVRIINGQTTENARNLNSETIKSPQNEIVLKGTKKYPVNIGPQNPAPVIGAWAWPTNKGYKITSKYGYRYIFGGWDFHQGLDISGTGKGSPIYAANDGVVFCSGYDVSRGNQKCGTVTGGQVVIIDHQNGYYTMYAHMVKGSQRVKTGDRVTRGQVIGGMGATGQVTGVHLHFGLTTGAPPHRAGSKFVDPMKLYR
jgi:murein DD-endopeptidase MepM/ murein hydrolase activator NlpD